jgi:hypothetical protein
MQRVERFVTSDGREFKTIDEAQRYEQMDTRCANVMAPLGVKPSLVENRFKQHSKDAFLGARTGLVMLAAEQLEQPRWAKDANMIHQHSSLGNFLREAADSPIYKYWARLMCFDDEGREFSTQFHATESMRTKRKPFKI